MISEYIVAAAHTDRAEAYPHVPPFLPDKDYPELKGRVPSGKHRNVVYEIFREVLRELEMDSAHFHSESWNPMGEVVRPGCKVLVKPNLVRHLHMSGGDYRAVVTHGSIVRCALDYVALALGGDGEIVVGDAPVQSADFGEIVRKTCLREVCEDVARIWGIRVKLVDFRLVSVALDNMHRIVDRKTQIGDDRGYVAVNLAEKSLLSPISDRYEKFRVTNYDCGEMKKHHNAVTHEYLIPRSVLESDVVINLPKLKTHRKVGLTGALKNLVGINGHKDWLPHHRCGSIIEGGDEYLQKCVVKRCKSRLGESIDRAGHSKVAIPKRLALRALHRVSNMIPRDRYEEGSWYGNDTLWRTVLDLNRILLYSDKNGRMHEEMQRKCLTIVDGIIGGEGEGPMEPQPRSCGLVVGGTNSVAVDATLATIVGFDYRKIPVIAKAFGIKAWPLVSFGAEDVVVRSNATLWDSKKVGDSSVCLHFQPPSGWKGQIEAS